MNIPITASVTTSDPIAPGTYYFETTDVGTYWALVREGAKANPRRDRYQGPDGSCKLKLTESMQIHTQRKLGDGTATLTLIEES